MEDMETMRQRSIVLNLGETLRLRDAGGRYIGIVAGEVWITQENDAHDRFLRAGEHFRFDRGGLALVWPLNGSARFALEDGLVPERKVEPQVISVTRDTWLAHRPFFERRVRQMRAEARGQATAQAVAIVVIGLRRLWGRMGGIVSAATRALHTARTLPVLGDSTLKNIGLHRDQISRIANPRPGSTGN